MSDTSRVQLAYVAESTFGAVKSAAKLTKLRYTGESLRQTSTTIRSNEIRSDRRVSSIRRSRIEAAGSVNGELSYGTWDDWMMAALQAPVWNAPVTVGPITTVAAVASGNTYTDGGAGLGGLGAGQWIYVTGFTTPANNGLKKIVTKAAGEITVSGGTLVDEEAGDSVTIKQFGYINEGTTLTSYNIEKTYADLTTDLALLVGMAPSGMGLMIPQDGVVTVNFDFMGVSEGSITASNGNGYNDVTTTPIFTARDLAAALEDQASMGIVGLSFKLNNNLRTRLECGSAGVASLGSGNVELTGTLTAYYKSKTLYDKFLDETATSIAAHLADTAGNRYVFELPQVKLTGGQRVAGGPNADVMAEMQWEAEMDGTESVMMRIARLAA